MKVSFDDVASATYAVLRHREVELAKRSSDRTYTFEAIAELLGPLLLTESAPCVVYYQTSDDVTKYMRLLFLRCDDAGRGVVQFSDFWHMLHEAFVRVRGRSSRSYAEWRPCRESAVSVSRSATVAGKLIRASIFSANTFSGAVNTVIGIVGSLWVYFNLHGDASVTCGVAGEAEDGERVCTARRAVFTTLRGQVLAVCPMPSESAHASADDVTAPSWVIVTSSASRMHLYQIAIGALINDDTEGAAVPWNHMASCTSRSQVLVCRCSSASSSSVVPLLAGTVIGEILVAEATLSAQPHECGVAVLASAALHSGSVADVQSVVIQGRQYIVSGGATDGRICISETVGRGTLVPRNHTVAHSGGVSSFSIIADTMSILSTGNNRTVRLWPASLDRAADDLVSPSGHDLLFCATAVSVKHHQMYALDIKGTMYAWDTRSLHLDQRLESSLPDRVKKTTNWTAMVLLPSSAMVLLTGGTASMIEARFATNVNVTNVCDDFPISAMAYYPSLGFVTAARNNVKVWDAHTGEMVSTFDSLTAAPISSIALCVEHMQLVCGLATGEANVVAAQSGIMLKKHRVFSHGNPVTFLAPTPCGTRVLAVARSGSVAVVSLADLNTLQNIVELVACSFDQSSDRARCDSVAVVDGDGRVAVIDPAACVVTIWELPSDQLDPVTRVLMLDLNPCRSSADPLRSMAFVCPMQLIAITDGCNVSLVDIAAGERPKRRVTWVANQPPVHVWYIPRLHSLVYADAEGNVTVDSLIHTLQDLSHWATLPPEASVAMPFTTSNFVLPSQTSLIVFEQQVPCWMTATSNREVLILDAAGCVAGRLDSSSASSADWCPLLGPQHNNAAKQLRRMVSGRQAAVSKNYERGGRRVRLAPLQRMIRMHGASSWVQPDNPAAVEALQPRHIPSPMRLPELSTRTVSERQTLPTQWSVDYPDDLAAEVHRNEKSSKVLAGMETMHRMIRCLGPSARVLADDRRSRDHTYNILHPGRRPQGEEAAHFSRPTLQHLPTPLQRLPPMARKLTRQHH